jgi:hypothetical protein
MAPACHMHAAHHFDILVEGWMRVGQCLGLHSVKQRGGVAVRSAVTDATSTRKIWRKLHNVLYANSCTAAAQDTPAHLLWRVPEAGLRVPCCTPALISAVCRVQRSVRMHI